VGENVPDPGSIASSRRRSNRPIATGPSSSRSAIGSFPCERIADQNAAVPK
jgi:hypothetical protein